jgi:hypothetical protein
LRAVIPGGLVLCGFNFLFSFWQHFGLMGDMGNDSSSRMNYIFVDFENVHELELDRIANKPVKVTVMVRRGAKEWEEEGLGGWAIDRSPTDVGYGEREERSRWSRGRATALSRARCSRTQWD